MNGNTIYKKLKIFVCFSLQFIASELTAGGVDIRAELAAHSRVDALLLEHSGEACHGVVSGADEAGLSDLIDRDEIDMDWKGLRAAVETVFES